MPDTNLTASRRTALAMLAGAPVAALAIPAAANAEASPSEDAERDYATGREDGSDLAFHYVARAWIDRFKALGGQFGLCQHLDSPRLRAGIGLPEPYVWEPPAEQNPGLEPHEHITDPADHQGAVKALLGLLTLCPQLRAVVYQLGAYEALTRGTVNREL
jgi:hypothetical protein